MMTVVTNLRTGEERTYSLPPREAVQAAHRQSLGDWNTWSYGDFAVVVEEGERTVACGDWAALKPLEP